MKEQKNVSVSGVKTYKGALRGKNIKVSGVSTVKNTDDLEINTAQSYIEEKNEYDNVIKVKGVSTVNGDLAGKEVSIRGVTTCRGNIECSKLNLGGVTTVTGGVSAHEAYIHWVVFVKENVTAEKVRINGAVRINGLVNAEEITVMLGKSKCKIGEIGGDRVKIKRKWYKKLGIFTSLGKIEIKTIEGSDIDIEDTYAEEVRGDNIIIGKGCKVSRVEYTGTLQVDAKAKVGERVKV